MADHQRARLGNDLLFTTLARENIETISSHSKTVKLLSICPHCVRTMSVYCGEAGRTVEIEHHLELLDRHKARLPASGETKRCKGVHTITIRIRWTLPGNLRRTA